MSMNYKELLKHTEWQKRRLEILSRDNWKCQSSSCKKIINILDVHHLDYLSGHKPWEYPDDMLISLCKNCHKLENIRFIHEQNLLTALKMKGFLISDLVALTTLLYRDKRILEIIFEEVKSMQKNV